MKTNILTYNGWVSTTALVLFLIFFSGTARAQQSFSFTQYPTSLTAINPNYSLIDGAGGVNAVIRKQYAGIDGSPTTLMLNGYLPIPTINAASGIIVLNDQLGNEKLTEVSAFFAKSVKMTADSYLAVSLNAGARFYKANYNALDPTGMDPTFANNINETKPNFGFGVMYYSDKYYVGISVPRITFKNIGEASIEDNRNFRNSYYLTGAYLADLAPQFKIKPSVLVSYTKGLPVTTDFTATLYAVNRLGIGMNYRTTNEMAGIISINTNTLNIGYSYQFGTGNTSGFHMATHELTVGIRFGKDLKGPKLL